MERYDVDIDPETEAIGIGSRGTGAFNAGDMDHGDTVLVRSPSYPNSYLHGAVSPGRRCVRFRGRGGFLQQAGRAIREKLSERQRNGDFGFPSNPTAQCVELRFLKSGGRSG